MYKSKTLKIGFSYITEPSLTFHFAIYVTHLRIFPYPANLQEFDLLYFIDGIMLSTLQEV